MLRLLVLLGCFWEYVVGLLHNITVDDQSPMITYSAGTNWERPTLSGSLLDLGGSHMLSSDPKSQATFTFFGVAVFFMSPLWPYPVASTVSLNGGPGVIIDLMDLSHNRTDGSSATVQSTAVWGATGLANAQHTLVVSVGRSPHAGPNDPQYVIVDGFIFTVEESASIPTLPTNTLSTSSTPPPSPTLSSSQSFQANSQKMPLPGPVVAAVACGAVGFFFILSFILFFFWWCKRRRRSRSPERNWTIDDDTPPPSIMQQNMSHSAHSWTQGSPTRNALDISATGMTWNTHSRTSYVARGHDPPTGSNSVASINRLSYVPPVI